MLGPMVNPLQPKNQLIGVFNSQIFRLYSHIYNKTDKNYCIVHGIDGYDEISLTGPFKLYSNNYDVMLEAKDLKLNSVSPESLVGGKNIKDSASIFLNILKNKSTKEQMDVVLANAGVAIYCAKNLHSIEDGILIAKDSIESGNAYKCFKTLMDI